MIRVKLLTDEEYLNDVLVCNKEDKTIFSYDETTFNYLADDKYFFSGADESIPPFRDEVSLNFLKKWGIRFIEGDWYSVYVDDGRSTIFGIRKDIKYGLALIDYSRRGFYLSYYSAGDDVWDVLNKLPFDILVAIKMSDISNCYSLKECDFLIENYPYNNQHIEVSVIQGCKLLDKSLYTEVSGQKAFSTTYGLHIGKDDKYYTDVINLGYAFQYYWKNDIEEIIKYLEEHPNQKRYIVENTQIVNIFQYNKMLKPRTDILVSCKYVKVLNYLKRFYKKEKSITKQQYEESRKAIEFSDYYKTYVWLRDKLKIINHLVTKPEDVTSRKLPMMIVDKNTDGTYFIFGKLTVKFPEFEEVLEEVIDFCSADYERFILVIDVEELMESVSDIDKAVYGFRVKENEVEVFDADMAKEQFGVVLKEAFYSGKCKVSEEFY